MSKNEYGWVVKPKINWIKDITFHYITIPIDLLNKIDLKPGDKTVFYLEGKKIIIKKEDK